MSYNLTSIHHSISYCNECHYDLSLGVNLKWHERAPKAGPCHLYIYIYMALPRDIWHLPQSFAEIFFYNWSLKTLKKSKIIGKNGIFLIFGFGKLWFWGKTNVFLIFCLRFKGPIFGTFWKSLFLWKLAIFMSNLRDDHCWYLSGLQWVLNSRD